ncbi:TPA: hypothetical protein TUM56_000224 [Streptococcus equi subsp. zooepidemicus]|nr:hypothetical protein Javan190_0046 [Streptococcus phage Javan190]QBX24583.1 hypothetical protein Javan192_0047 [Streptococcus phage Javan192]HEL0006907.1 hypothetical protein [Streptococcus equi subsp. zooepidemicus]HEL0114082.1 hypothetical protein [Streptococcus equi subsp. zooepidemicus]HEL0116119.1 hypothetical protein [Streptococcus equi subsp. zooepidemicus]
MEKSIITQESISNNPRLITPFPNSIGVVGFNLQEVLTLLSENITKEFEAGISSIMVDKCNTGEWLATVARKVVKG